MRGENDRLEARVAPNREPPTYAAQLGGRIKQIADKVGHAKLAELIGVGTTTLYRYINGSSVPALDVAAAIAECGAVGILWLTFGDQSRYESGAATVLTTDGNPPPHEARQHGGDFNDFVKIPLYDITASAGSGAWNDNARIKSYLAFRRDWLRFTVGVNPDADGLGLVSASGDSMPKSAPDGSVVMIQPLRYAGFAEGVNLMLLNGMHIIKYVQRLELLAHKDIQVDVRVRIVSENPLHPPIETWITEANEHETTVIGRAVWMGVRL